MRLVPGAADFIESAALDAFQLAIVSGALRREIELVLELAGLRPHFAEIVAAEDVSACKPDPQGYRRGAAALGVAPERCVVIEDSLPGLAAARAAGMSCVMLATSHPAEAMDGADLVWKDFVGHDPSELVRTHV
jgi:mannitol-1-/sugar-/sorbitol-6-phosphatase